MADRMGRVFTSLRAALALRGARAAKPTTVAITGVCLGILLCGACASTPEAETGPREPEVLSAKDYYPLAIGNKWTYRGEPHPEDVHIEIVSLDDGFFVDNNEPPSRLQPRASGIFDGDRFLLEDPLEVGHTWMAVPSVAAVERYEIVATDFRMQTPAGSFSECVRVRAEVPGRTPAGDKMKLIMNWTYAPRVGLVRLEQKIQIGDQKPRVGMWMELVAYEVSTS